jgi:hypothetical protein
MRLPRLACCCAILTTLCVATPRAYADRDSSTPALLAAGAGMAVPTYMLGVMWHEGTHALFASGFGAELLELRLYPSVYRGHFYFGLTRWRGELSEGERAFTLVAPKLTDLVLLGGYAAIVAADALPDNDYAALALTVLATGAWVDFAKDLFSTNPTNDLIKVHTIYGHTTEWQRLPWRLVQGALSAAAGLVLYVGYADVFAAKSSPTPPPMLFQLYSGTF